MADSDRGWRRRTSENEWIYSSLKRRECYRPVCADSEDSESEENALCVCGTPMKGHVVQDLQRSRKGERWTKLRNTRLFPTNAYGQHTPKGQKKSVKFVRIDDTTDDVTLKTLLTDVWHLPRPRFVMSIMGKSERKMNNASKFQTHTEDVLKRLSSEKVVWLLSDGLGKSSSHSACQAVDNFRKISRIGYPVVPIEVYPWTLLKNKRKLLIGEAKENKRASSCKGEFRLHNYADYAILVDSGIPKDCVSYRSMWMRLQLSLTDKHGDTPTVPSVIILFGGIPSKEGIHKAIQNDMPVIVMKGSGGMAEALAVGCCESLAEKKTYVDCKVDEFRSSAIIHGALLEKLKKEVNYEEHDVQLILQCLQKRHLLTVCDLQNPADDLFRAIICALLKSTKLENLVKWMDCFLPCSIMEDRWEQGKYWHDTNNTLDIVIVESIVMEPARTDFVELILKYGFVTLHELFDDITILYLYSKSFNKLPEALQQILHSKDFDEIPELYNKRTRQDLYCSGYLDDSDDTIVTEPRDWSEGNMAEKMDTYKELLKNVRKYLQRHIPQACKIQGVWKYEDQEVEKDLLLWALVSNRTAAARLFWKYNNHIVVSALFASTMLDGLADETDNAVYRKHARLFENRAIGTLEVCYDKDRERTQQLLENMNTENQWNVSILQVAMIEKNCRILSTEAYMGYFNNLWRGHIDSKIHILKIIIGIFLFPLVFVNSFIKFKQMKKNEGNKNSWNTWTSDEQSDSQDNQEERKTGSTVDKKTNISPCRKLELFYSSVVVKYIISVVCYIIFLGIFGHLILFDLHPDFTPLEAVLAVWIVSITAEEIIQFASCSLKCAYFTEGWNVLDMISIGMYVFGVALRFRPETYEVGRIILSLDFMLFFWRLLHICAVSSQLGPVLIMIWRMVTRDFIPYLLILFVFIESYAIATEAILFPNSVWTWEFILYLSRKAFLQIFGELSLEEIEGDMKDPDCTNDRYLAASNRDYTRCPSEVGKYLVPVMMAFYMLGMIVLLLNIVIAIFNNRFQNIWERNHEYWAWKKCRLILEYKAKPTLPVPLSLIFRVAKIVTRVFTELFIRIETFYQNREVRRLNRMAQEMKLIEPEVPQNYIENTRWRFAFSQPSRPDRHIFGNIDKLPEDVRANLDSTPGAGENDRDSWDTASQGPSEKSESSTESSSTDWENGFDEKYNYQSKSCFETDLLDLKEWERSMGEVYLETSASEKYMMSD